MWTAVKILFSVRLYTHLWKKFSSGTTMQWLSSRWTTHRRPSHSKRYGSLSSFQMKRKNRSQTNLKAVLVILDLWYRDQKDLNSHLYYEALFSVNGVKWHTENGHTLTPPNNIRSFIILNQTLGVRISPFFMFSIRFWTVLDWCPFWNSDDATVKQHC